ncbi:hypothetical protein VTK26DRAFT_6389 [Humicola hyalothermophila]
MSNNTNGGAASGGLGLRDAAAARSQDRYEQYMVRQLLDEHLSAAGLMVNDQDAEPEQVQGSPTTEVATYTDHSPALPTSLFAHDAYEERPLAEPLPRLRDIMTADEPAPTPSPTTFILTIITITMLTIITITTTTIITITITMTNNAAVGATTTATPSLTAPPPPARATPYTQFPPRPVRNSRDLRHFRPCRVKPNHFRPRRF